MKSLSYKQWKESLGGIGEPNQPPINPNEPSKVQPQNAQVRPIDMRMRMQKLKLNKPMQ